MALCPRKSALRAYFGLEGVEQVWTTIEDNWPNNVGPLIQVKMVKKIAHMLQKWKREAKVDPNVIKLAK